MSAFGYDNKSTQSNLGRGPRRGGVAHVRRKVLIGYSGAPQNRPKSTTSRGSIPKPHHLPHPWTRPTYEAKRHPNPIRRFFHNALDRQTDRPTDRLRESLTAIGRCAPIATRPNNSNNNLICKAPVLSRDFSDSYNVTVQRIPDRRSSAAEGAVCNKSSSCRSVQ